MISKAPRRLSRLWQGRSRGALMAMCLWLVTTAPAIADTIVAARYTEPTTRYPHGVLGDQIEYGALELTIENTPATQGSTGAKERSALTIRLPEDRVFEDLAPRLSDVDQNGTLEVLVVEAQKDTGAQLAIYNAHGEKIAATPHIGTRFRWLAPIGAADLDGDGYVEIAYIDRPHLAKTLRIWRFKDGALTEIAVLPDLTNHKIGEAYISSAIRDCGTGPEMVVASADWSTIVSVSYRGDWQTRDLGPLKKRSDLTNALIC